MNRATQLARGAAAAAVALFLAAFSHGAAAGEAPGGPGLALSAFVALAVSVALVGRRSSPLRVVLATAASQLVFHLLFSVGAGAGGAGALLRVSGDAHHPTVTALPDASGATAAPLLGHGHTDAAMLLGHVLAWLATVAYLLAVEAAAWRALRRTARAVLVRAVDEASALAAIPVPAGPLVRPLARDRARLRGRQLVAQLRHRGPPRHPAFA
ncbi:hypothetical protein [Agromyces soli]|uniref:MFS transporter n=1 Tax=Agromyces soli TaxID=659012 RepID=A0ABY4AXK9_9MICO|nr:hypothetical protein [Agromyces soli]UOE27569.1 hypothetical protein MTP13_07265 [Agromyces soli]